MNAVPGDAPQFDDARRQLVDRARERWEQRLIDVSRRNNLLYFRDLKVGTLDLVGADIDQFRRLMNGDTVPAQRLLPDVDEKDLGLRLQDIHRRALANQEEKGLQTLFLALGMATWTEDDGGRAPEAAVVLVPVQVEARGTVGRSFALKRAGEPSINLALLHVLAQLGSPVDADEMLDAGRPTAVAPADATDHEEEPFDHEAVLAALEARGSAARGFAVARRAVLGNFSFQKLAMVQDLRERGQEMAEHDLVAAIAGDEGARRAVLADRVDMDARALDRVPPDDEFLVLDADSTQKRAVAAVMGGQSGVVQGPPGTGKSQTITNLIAALVAEGKKILFVAEKRAALEVVLARLQSVGLGHIALDLHGADVSRRQIMQRVADGLAHVQNTPPVEVGDLPRRIVERRHRLNEHAARMHRHRAPSGSSVYELRGHLVRAQQTAPAAATRWRGGDLAPLTAEVADAVRALLAEAAGFGGLFLRDPVLPWSGAPLDDGAKVEQALDLVATLAGDHLPRLRRTLGALAAATGLPAPGTIAEARVFLELLDDTNRTLASYPPAIYAEDLAARAAGLAPAASGFLSALFASWFNGGFKTARGAVSALRAAGPVPAAQLLAEVRAAADQLARWRARGGATASPTAIPDAPAARAALDAVVADLAGLAPLVDARYALRPPDNHSFEELGAVVGALDADPHTPHRLPRLHEVERAIEAAGAGRLVEELRERRPPATAWPAVFDHAWLASCLDAAYREDPAIAGFEGRSHDQVVEEFVRLDQEWLRVSAARVKRAHAEAVVAAMNAHPDQAVLVRREAQKRARHLALRTLLSRAPDVLTALHPCWMASPLSVSQLIAGDRRYFDVVVFDEASQVLPEDAAAALLRAPLAVVAGDQRQLPPTTFFAAGDGEGDAEEDLPTEGFESVLDLMAAFFTPWPLQWHYRSRDEALIAFANREMYGDSLITFPGPGGDAPVAHVLVPSVPGMDGQEESAAAEVRRVVDLVVEHAETRPNETLGVIAMGIQHANRVQFALDEALRLREDLAPFFDERKPERFFVKNLERVQGDERDAVILTIGAAKDRSGRLDLRRFGPLNSEGGKRRLNVAVTRARKRMTLVTSFTQHDVPPSPNDDKGVDMLRRYVEYTSSGGRRMGDAGGTGVALNPFEQDIRTQLEAHGVPIVPQWGASSYRIDLVAQHPHKPGRLVLAIECDGATYHSAPTARDRDRLRQQQLEALGWRFHRIWSTDWFMRREEETRRALDAFGDAVRRADKDDVREATAAAIEQVGSSAGRSEDDGDGAAPTTDPRAAKLEPRPDVPFRPSIDEYSRSELQRLLLWLQSDGRLRTDDELVDEMVEQLGFQRRGAKIVAAVREVLAALRRSGRMR